MALQPRVPRSPVHEGPLAEARLQGVGIPSSQTVVDALAIGGAAFRSCDARHPRSYPGTRMWAETFHALAFSLTRVGWTVERDHNVEMLVSPDEAHTIIVTAGDMACGHRDVFPQVKYERGEVISGMINGTTPQMFGSTTPSTRSGQIWFLLHRVRTTMVDAELSIPRGIDDAGFVTGWTERILIPQAPPRPGTQRRTQPAPVQPGTAPIHVPVVRRGA